MSLNLKKIKSFVGFAEKSGSIVYGTDNLVKSNKLTLIIVSDKLGESSQKKIESYAKTNSISLLKLSDEEVFEIVTKTAVKAFGITDKNLADAIINILANKN